MSGGSFDYVYIKVQDVEVINGNTLNSLVEMKEWLEAVGREKEAETVDEFIKDIEEVYQLIHDRLIKKGTRIAPLLQAVEWVCSSDWGQGAIDRAYEEYKSK